MRLLTQNESGGYVFESFESNSLPAYAILSHTWYENNSDEVTYQDLLEGRAVGKPGYDKIQFCGKQAVSDGLRYFWVDTCCINKHSDPELSESINSMFLWYQKAMRCYVYLADVVFSRSGNGPGPNRSEWEPLVRQSRWFTRGWTLQELLAPRDVQFFSSNEVLLGDNVSLEPLLCDVTGINRDALRGEGLYNFGLDEKMKWAENRNTKREEDRVYSLLGIFDVSMPLVYGEGREKAHKRLLKEIDEANTAPGPDEYVVGLSLARIPSAAKFVAREWELSQMHQRLRKPHRSVVVLHGLGGMGKTQLAVTYIQRHKTKYSAVFWIDADSDDSIRSSFRAVAKQIRTQHPSTIPTSVDLEGDPTLVIDTVLSWLSLAKNTQWLLVYDNYDNPKIAGDKNTDVVDLDTYMPQFDHGAILITTRSSQVDLRSFPIPVKKLSNVREGLAILSYTSHREGIEHDPSAIALAEELGGLPLALSTAGAYLEQVSTSFAEYHDMYKASWSVLQQLSPQLASYADRRLYTTWQLSLDRIQRQDKSAAKLLKLWAYFDRQDVWYELLKCSVGSKWLRRLTRNRARFDKTMRLLCSYGLVDPNTPASITVGSTGYSVHSCVHAWMMSVLNKEWDNEHATLALHCVVNMVPDLMERDSWLTQGRLLPHVPRCARFIDGINIDTKDLIWSLAKIGYLHAHHDNLDEAETMFIHALEVVEAKAEAALELKPSLAFYMLDNLGGVYRQKGKLDQAEMMYIRALEGCEKTYGPNNPDTFIIINNLGATYQAQGRLDEAETMFKRALEGNEEALGPKHVATLAAVHSLGRLYKKQGKLSVVEDMFKRALEGTEEALGPNHLITIDTALDLGHLYQQQEKLSEAEKMYIRALERCEESLGPQHMSTLRAFHNLGIVYSNQEKLSEAEAMLKRYLAGCEAVFGPKHNSSLTAVHNLGCLYDDQGNLSEAEAMYKRALDGYKEAAGQADIKTYVPALDTISEMGVLYAKQGKLEEAFKLCMQAQNGYEKALGTTHPSMLATSTNLGYVYQKQGKLDEAEEVLTRALDGYNEGTGPVKIDSHMVQLLLMWRMGDLFAELCQIEKAFEMYSAALSGYTTLQGPSSDKCQEIRKRMAALNDRKASQRAGEELGAGPHQAEQASETDSAAAPGIATERPPSSDTRYATQWDITALINRKGDQRAVGHLYSKPSQAELGSVMGSATLSGVVNLHGTSSDASHQLWNCLMAMSQAKIGQNFQLNAQSSSQETQSSGAFLTSYFRGLVG